MTQAGLTELLTAAAERGRGLGAFNVFSIEHAEAIVSGAETAGTAVVLQLSQNAVRYHGALLPIGLATLAIARSSRVSAAVHLDHADDLELVDKAIELGFSSVMFDASRLPYAANVEATADVVRRGHRGGVAVEAELGEVGGKDGVHAPGARTQPGEAREFVAATGVDALAVAVGTSHAMAERRTAVDLDLISELRDAVPVPLVLHGSSGVSDEELRRAVRAGMTKINMATHLNHVFTDSVRATLAGNPELIDSRRYLGPARDAMAAEVARLLALLSA
ncbi:MAG TPA: class II fructose-bisphosphate aldolase [Propionibacteriaceae bacterium]|nr:class II fructose-bisphosphate aldolase [Propionibacteriaceae bacterium]